MTAKNEPAPLPTRTVMRISAACTLCDACMPLCPTKSIFYGRAQYVIDSTTCEMCGTCAKVCPVHVIHPMEIPLSLSVPKPASEGKK